MSYTTGKISWRDPLTFNTAISSKPKAVQSRSHIHMHPHIISLASPRWAVSLGVRRQYRPRRSSVIAIVQPTMVMHPNSFPRAPHTLYDHDIWQAGCWDSVMESFPQCPSRWIRLSDDKWPKRTSTPTVAKCLWLIAELSLAPILLERSP